MARKAISTNFPSYVLLCLGSMLVLYPIYIVFVTSFKTPAEVARSWFSLPSSLYLGNFELVLGKANYLQIVFNSTVITSVSVALIVCLIPLAAYAVARNMNRAYFKFLYFYFISGIFVPFQVIMIPLVKLTSTLGMNNIPGLIVLNVTYALIQGVFLFVGFINTIPRELEEAAHIDGCGVLKTFAQVIYPLLQPMLATIVVIRGLFIWNDFMLPLIILNKSQSFWTLPLFQYNFKSEYTVDYNSAFASYLMAIVPVIVVYVFMQKYIISGLTSGAVKG
jgi:raffinose/stachyose/melibiose transport system permease protein